MRSCSAPKLHLLGFFFPCTLNKGRDKSLCLAPSGNSAYKGAEIAKQRLLGELHHQPECFKASQSCAGEVQLPAEVSQPQKKKSLFIPGCLNQPSSGFKGATQPVEPGWGWHSCHIPPLARVPGLVSGKVLLHKPGRGKNAVLEWAAPAHVWEGFKSENWHFIERWKLKISIFLGLEQFFLGDGGPGFSVQLQMKGKKKPNSTDPQSWGASVCVTPCVLHSKQEKIGVLPWQENLGSKGRAASTP